MEYQKKTLINSLNIWEEKSLGVYQKRKTQLSSSIDKVITARPERLCKTETIRILDFVNLFIAFVRVLHF